MAVCLFPTLCYGGVLVSYVCYGGVLVFYVVLWRCACFLRCVMVVCLFPTLLVRRRCPSYGLLIFSSLTSYVCCYSVCLVAVWRCVGLLRACAAVCVCADTGHVA
jgi:hypothetical protein